MANFALKNTGDATFHFRWHPPPSKMTLIYENMDFAYIGIPKCASTSIRRGLNRGEWSFLSHAPEDALSVGTRMAVIREPMDRLFSAWNYAWREIPFGDWWAMIREDPERDIHTYRQKRWIQPGQPTEIYRLEEWYQWWPEMVSRYPDLFPEVMPWRNHIDRDFDLSDFSEYHDEIREVYASDLSLYETLKL